MLYVRRFLTHYRYGLNVYLLDELPPCTLLDVEGSGEEGTEEYANSEDQRIPGVTCKLLPPCTINPNSNGLDGRDFVSSDLSADVLNNQKPRIDCTYDYYEYDYENEESSSDYVNQQRNFGGNKQNRITFDTSSNIKSIQIKEAENNLSSPMPPRLDFSHLRKQARPYHRTTPYSAV